MKINFIVSTIDKLQFRNQNEICREFIIKRIRHFFPKEEISFLDALTKEQIESEEIYIFTDTSRPFLCADVINKLKRFAIKTDNQIVSEGEVPGTSPLKVLLGKNVNSAQKKIFDSSQAKFNSQVNLNRLKRVKIFNSFLRQFPDFHEWTLSRLMEFTASRQGVEFVLAYGESVNLQYYPFCPLCSETEVLPLTSRTSHPVIGYLNSKSEYYHRCQNCELVFLNPHLTHRDLKVYYDEYNFETNLKAPDYRSLLENLDDCSVSHYANYLAVSKYILKLGNEGKCLDLGGGYGEFCSFLKNFRKDLNVNMIDFRVDPELSKVLKEKNIESKQSDFITENMGESCYDLVTNWEVIEHIDLKLIEEYFQKLFKALKPGGLYILSTPDFDDPFCRSLDFWAMAPGEHVSVFSQKIIVSLLLKIGFEFVEVLHECVTMKTSNRWYKYGMESNASISSRADSWIVDDFIKWDKDKEYRKNLRERNQGSEMILIFRKKNENY